MKSILEQDKILEETEVQQQQKFEKQFESEMGSLLFRAREDNELEKKI